MSSVSFVTYNPTVDIRVVVVHWMIHLCSDYHGRVLVFPQMELATARESLKNKRYNCSSGNSRYSNLSSPQEQTYLAVIFEAFLPVSEDSRALLVASSNTSLSM